MRSLTRSNARPRIHGLYSKLAELLFIGLLLVFAYPFFYVVSGVDPSIPSEGQSQTKIVYFLQLAFPFFCLAIAFMCRGSDVFRCLPGAIMVFPIICLASTIWSVDPYDTAKYASLLFLYILAVAAVCQVLDIEVFCKLIVKVLAFLILASVVMAVVFPRYGTHQLSDGFEIIRAGLWRGVFIHKNQLGATASVSLFIFLFCGRLMGASWLRMMCTVAAIACLIFAESAGSWVAVFVLLLIYYLIRAVRVAGSILVLLVLSVSVLTFAVVFVFGEGLVAVIGRDATFTGRTYIWPIVLDAALQQPIVGFGYYAATADFMRPLLVAWIGPGSVDAHNGYLEVLLGTGIVGLVSLVFWISSVIVRGIGRVTTSVGSERDCFILLLIAPISSLLFSIFEVHAISGVQGGLGPLTFLSLTAIPSYLRFHRGYYYQAEACKVA